MATAQGTHSTGCKPALLDRRGCCGAGQLQGVLCATEQHACGMLAQVLTRPPDFFKRMAYCLNRRPDAVPATRMTWSTPYSSAWREHLYTGSITCAHAMTQLPRHIQGTAAASIRLPVWQLSCDRNAKPHRARLQVDAVHDPAAEGVQQHALGQLVGRRRLKDAASEQHAGLQDTQLSAQLYMALMPMLHGQEYASLLPMQL